MEWNYTWLSIIFFLVPLSLTFSAMIPLIYYKYPETRQHPNILLVLICLTEIMIVYHLALIFGLPLITKYTFAHSDSWIFVVHLPTLLEYLGFGWFFQNYGTIQGTNVCIFIILIFLQQSLIAVWCIDIILNLQYPFISGKKRMSAYLLLITFLLIFLILSNFQGIENQFNQFKDTTEDPGQIDFLIQCFFLSTKLITYFGFEVSFFVIMAVTYSYLLILFYYAYKTKNSFHKRVKTAFIKQQVIMISVIILAQILPIMLIELMELMFTANWSNEKDVLGAQTYMAYMFIEIQGICLCLVRLQDCFFREKLVIMFSILRGRTRVSSVSTDSQTHADALNIPLTNLITMVEGQEVLLGILNGISAALSRVSSNVSAFKEICIFSMHLGKPNKVNHIQYEMESSGSQQQHLLQNPNETPLRIVEHTPKLFRDLIAMSGLTAQVIIDSLNPENNQDSLQALSESLGRSGAFFFFTQDSKFIIKTITQQELNFLTRNFIFRYTSYIMAHPRSLLAKILGCYSLYIENVSPIHLVLMENSLEHLQKPFQLYDLKGSLFNRKSLNQNVLKDLDLLESDHPLQFFKPSQREGLLEQIRHDSRFLSDCNVMDYSLLMAIKAKEANLFNQGQVSFIDSSRYIEIHEYLYSLTIIDYFQEFNLLKSLENKYKALFNPVDSISSVKPSQYSERFITFMNQILCKYHQQ